MRSSRLFHRRRRVESSWVLNADQLPRPVRAGAEGTLVVTTREGNHAAEIGYLIRNDGAGFVLDLWTQGMRWEDTIRIRIDLVPLQLGGSRTYLRCPGLAGHPACLTRALKLYWPLAGTGGFACRDCHQLAYRSSQQRPRPLPELRAFVERPRHPLPSPAAAWRRYERLQAGSATTRVSEDDPAASAGARR